MTVATETAYAEFTYTGVETTFSPGFSALDAADVLAGYFDSSGQPIVLTPGVHFTASISPITGAVTVTAIAFPSASAAAPVTIYIERDTPAIQDVDFQNLNRYDPSVHQLIADAGAMRDAEIKARQDRVVTPFAASATVVDFRPRIVRAADPLDDADIATKAYVDQVSGTDAAMEAAASAAAATASAADAAASDATAAEFAAAAAASSVLLVNRDYGQISDAPTIFADFGALFDVFLLSNGDRLLGADGARLMAIPGRG